jgi:hypothetical protein
VSASALNEGSASTTGLAGSAIEATVSRPWFPSNPMLAP